MHRDRNLESFIVTVINICTLRNTLSLSAPREIAKSTTRLNVQIHRGCGSIPQTYSVIFHIDKQIHIGFQWRIQDFPLGGGGAPIYWSEPGRLRCAFIVIFTLFYINTNNRITLHSFIYLLVSLRF